MRWWKGRRAQHHGDADRLVAGRAGTQSAPRANTAVARRDASAARTAIQFRRRSGGADAAAAQCRSAPSQPPVQRADDGYIYPADGSSNEARYPAPRGSRRVYDAQAYPQPQQHITIIAAMRQAPPGYYQPLPQYQPRGLFTIAGSDTVVSRSQAGCRAASSAAISARRREPPYRPPSRRQRR